jgi:hypothetical protein
MSMDPEQVLFESEELAVSEIERQVVKIYGAA